MRFLNSLLTVTACCLLATYAAAARPQSKKSIEAQGRKLASPNDILSPDDFIACTKKLVTGIDAYYGDTQGNGIDEAGVLNNKGLGFDTYYQAFKHIITRTYCEDTVDYVYDLSIYSNYTQRTLLDDAKAVMKEIQTRRQRALIVSLGGDQENDDFYPPSGGGYDVFTSGAVTSDCPNRFREGCTEDAHGAAWTAFFAGRSVQLLADAVEAGDAGGAAVTAAKIAAATAFLIVEDIVDLYAFIDTFTGGAKQDIANANVKVLLENQAKIFNKFSIDGTLTTRRQRLMVGAGENMEEGDTRNLQTNIYLRGYGCDGIDNDNSGQVDECAEDVFGPTINSEVFIAVIRGKWFTNETELLTLLQGTVDISDDCGLATYTNITLFQACKESILTVEIEDRCGNAAVEVIPVWFDPTPPMIQATLGNSVLDKFESKEFYVDVGLSDLSTAISDECDPTPLVEIEVFSDELPLGPPGKSLSIVQLVRQYTAHDLLFTGWRVNVHPQAAKICDGKKNLCEEADGRVYTIRVCTTDAAGIRTCQELEVEVPLLVKNPLGAPPTNDKWKKGGRDLTSKGYSATSQGKLFLIQSDSGKLNAI